MENQEQQNKIMGVMTAVFILMIIVTTATAIIFLTEKNKLVKQNKIANDIIWKYNNSGIKKVLTNVPSDSLSESGDGAIKEALSEAELTIEKAAYLERRAVRAEQLQKMQEEDFAIMPEDEFMEAEVESSEE